MWKNLFPFLENYFEHSVNDPHFYNLLQIKPNASTKDIQRQFHQLSIVRHPDKGGDAKEFQEIVQAYNVLKDYQKRRVYDVEGLNGIQNSGISFNLPHKFINSIRYFFFDHQTTLRYANILVTLLIAFHSTQVVCTTLSIESSFNDVHLSQIIRIPVNEFLRFSEPHITRWINTLNQEPPLKISTSYCYIDEADSFSCSALEMEEENYPLGISNITVDVQYEFVLIVEKYETMILEILNLFHHEAKSTTYWIQKKLVSSIDIIGHLNEYAIQLIVSYTDSIFANSELHLHQMTTKQLRHLKKSENTKYSNVKTTFTDNINKLDYAVKIF